MLATFTRPANKERVLRVELGVRLDVLDNVGHHRPRHNGEHGSLVDGCSWHGTLQERVLDTFRVTFAKAKYTGKLDVAKPNRSCLLYW
jgi:hypothetical protein